LKARKIKKSSKVFTIATINDPKSLEDCFGESATRGRLLVNHQFDQITGIFKAAEVDGRDNLPDKKLRLIEMKNRAGSRQDVGTREV
jgi:hypothetical protein